MARKVPNSNKSKKTQLQTNRAQKTLKKLQTPTLHPQDEAEAAARPPPVFNAALLPISARPSGAPRYRTLDESARDNRKEKQTKMESRFLRLPLDLLQHHRQISASEPLIRPIPETLGVIKVEELQPAGLEGLTCPKRPKWSYNSSKLEVEKNEEGMFAKWLNSTDAILADFSKDLRTTPAPTFFERNLQVWRQLWRVTEVSSILLILIDVRFPLIHYPPSLEAYVKTLRPAKKVILVLTKTDLVPRWLAQVWKTWFEEREGPEGASVILMESYRESDRSVLTQGTQPRFVPAAPTSFRLSLLAALKKAHTELLTPPEIVSSVPARLARWSPKLRSAVDWSAVESEESTLLARTAPAPEDVEVNSKGKERKLRRNKKKDEYVERKKRPLPGQEEEVVEEEEPVVVEEPAVEEVNREDLVGDDAYPFLTIGLIGQPNVGKSSLLNALLGRKVAKASRTPGKTKTLQTIFWSDTIRLCDCPGLVCPSFAGMERQVLSGILPIQNVEPVLYFLAQRMPFEKILQLKHPDQDDYPEFEDGPPWTADELLSTYALNQGFITAKAGRPDLYRGGAFILRQLHSSSIPWAFRPPFAGDPTAQDQEGIWIPNFTAKASSKAELEREKSLMNHERSGSEEESDASGSEEEEEESESDEEEEEEDSADERAVKAVRSAFAMLDVEGGEDDSEEEEQMVPYPDQLDIPVDPALQSTFSQSTDTPSSSRLNEGEDESADLQVGAADRTISTESQPDGEAPFEPYLLRDTPRFCPSCRVNRVSGEFVSGRKACYRHAPDKFTSFMGPPDTLPTLDSIAANLQKRAEEDNLGRYEAWAILSNLPDQEKVKAEIKAGKDKWLAKKRDDGDPGELMRVQRARCRPLVEMVQNMTGYNFVYKDTRSGAKLKFAHCVRYLCAQREEGDGTRKRPVKRRKKEDSEEVLVVDDSLLENSIAAAIRAAVVPEEDESDGDDEDHDDSDDDGDYPDSIRVPQGDHDDNAQGSSSTRDVSVDLNVGLDGGPAHRAYDTSFDGENGYEVSDYEVDGPDRSHSHSNIDPSLQPSSYRDQPYTSLFPRQPGSPKSQIYPNGKGKGWRKGSGTPRVPSKNPQKNKRAIKPPKEKKEPKSLERYPCRGSLVISILHDDIFAHFHVTHCLTHPPFADRVKTPRPQPKYVDLNTALREPLGSLDMEGKDIWDTTESALYAMIELCRLLRVHEGGGGEDAITKLYAELEPARKFRVSVIEALARGGGVVPQRFLRELTTSRIKKRKWESEDEAPSKAQQQKIAAKSQKTAGKKVVTTARVEGGDLVVSGVASGSGSNKRERGQARIHNPMASGLGLDNNEEERLELTLEDPASYTNYSQTHQEDQEDDHENEQENDNQEDQDPDQDLSVGGLGIGIITDEGIEAAMRQAAADLAFQFQLDPMLTEE